jgi:SAM-dependent methyltransferase
MPTLRNTKPSMPLSQRAKLSKYDSEQFSRAQEVAHARLYPSIFASNYLVLRNRRVHMQEFFARRESVGRVLDVGAQYCPYYPLFEHKCESYTSMDIVDTPIVDIVCNAEEMPVEDCSYDLVLCTQVLEHCANPQRIVDECHRVLKPQGTLIVTVPSVYPMHGYPADNWRFMPDGLRYLLRTFSEVEVLGELDFPESLASVNCHYGHVFTGKMGKLGLAINPLWNFATNIGGRVMSWVLRPLTRSNFTAFSMNLWGEARKSGSPLGLRAFNLE